MDKGNWNLSGIPVINVFFRVNGSDVKPLADACQIVLVPVSHQKRLAVSGFNQIFQSI